MAKSGGQGFSPQGGVSQYGGPGSSMNKNRKVGSGQDKPAPGSKRHEATEAKAEKKEDRAIKDLQSAQKSEKKVGAGQMPSAAGATRLTKPTMRGSIMRLSKASTPKIPEQVNSPLGSPAAIPAIPAPPMGGAALGGPRGRRMG